MAVTHGMNPDEVERLGRLLQQKADALRQLTAALERSVARTTWTGPVARQFLQGAWPRHRAKLHESARAIHGFGQSALNNAVEQRRVSDARGGGAGHVRRGPVELPRGIPPLPKAVAGYFTTRSGEEMFDDAKFWTGLKDLGSFALQAGGIVVTGQAAREMVRAVKVPGVVGAGVMVAEVGISGKKIAEAIRTGNVDQGVRSSIDVVFSVASLNPYVAAGKMAWDASWAGTMWVDEKLGITDGFSTEVVHSTIVDRYGTSELTQAQAAEYSKRYDGVSGFFNHTIDSGKTTWSAVRSIFR